MSPIKGELQRSILVYVLWVSGRADETHLDVRRLDWVDAAARIIGQEGIEEPIVLLSHLSEGQGLESLSGRLGHLLGAVVTVQEAQRTDAYPLWVNGQWNLPVLNAIEIQGEPARVMVCVLKPIGREPGIYLGEEGSVDRYAVAFNSLALLDDVVIAERTRLS